MIFIPAMHIKTNIIIITINTIVFLYLVYFSNFLVFSVINGHVIKLNKINNIPDAKYIIPTSALCFLISSLHQV